VTLSAQQRIAFHSVLSASGRSQEIPECADIYGWLVGSWELDVYDYQPDGTVRKSNGEVHFAWVLEGRAVQDVWIMPRLSDRRSDLRKAGNRYGMTVRVWDPSIQAWRVTWINPVTGARDELVGRKSGNNIVQIGTHSDGTPIRWIFSEVTPDSFRWTGEVLQPDGETWKLEDEFRAHRIRQ
jgi:hypothetical protein